MYIDNNIITTNNIDINYPSILENTKKNIIKVYIWSVYYDECLLFFKHIIDLLQDSYKIIIVNEHNNCDIIFTNHYKTNINININKKIIYWSGESYPNSILNNNKPYIELDSFINKNSSTSIYMPFFLSSTYWKKNIRQLNNTKSKFMAFCVSNPRAQERIYFFNRFCELLPDKCIEALGKVYGNYKSKQRCINGFHTNYQTIEEYSNYKFILAAENKIKEGYVTEKIINAFASGSVPIYWGCSKTVKSIFNKNAFIDINDFNSIDECINYVNNISDEQYNMILKEPVLNNSSILNIVNDNNEFIYEKHPYWKNIKNILIKFIET